MSSAATTNAIVPTGFLVAITLANSIKIADPEALSVTISTDIQEIKITATRTQHPPPGVSSPNSKTFITLLS